jgi:type 2 lantibiotic biosynthesis protein LanM
MSTKVHRIFRDKWMLGSYLAERKNTVTAYDRKMDFGKDFSNIEKWEKICGLQADELTERLNQEEISREVFEHILLNESAPKLKYDLPWALEFENILQHNAMINEELQLQTDLFQPFFSFFLSYAKEKLLTHPLLQQSNLFVDADSVIQIYIHNLHSKLLSLSLRTLISELNIARITEDLAGNTPKERYHSFNLHYLTGREKIASFLSVYPVLARLITQTLEYSHTYLIEILSRFEQDQYSINALFGEGFSLVQKIEVGEGDSHLKGRSVAILTFNSGKKLVYKPRSLAVDDHFQKLLLWFNQKQFKQPFRTTLVINRENYGWYEFIENKECLNEEEAVAYHYRLGGYLAISYLLSSADLHSENLIACGDSPVLIDLETALSNDINLGDRVSPFPAVVKELNTSVYGTMMLPVTFPSGQLIDVDLSAVGGKHGSESVKVKVWAVEKEGTDEMRLIQIPYVSPKSSNQPRLKGEELNAFHYRGSIEEGFRDLYTILLMNTEELLGGEGPIYSFSHDTIRHVLRPTHVYAKFLEASTHPDYLQNGLHRERLFDSFWRITSLIPDYRKIVKSECCALLDHDVPYFTMKAGSRDLYDGDGNIYPSFFAQSCIELTLKKLQMLNQGDLKKQLRYIRLSLNTLGENEPQSSKVQSDECLVLEPMRVEEYLKEARKIGDKIYNEVIWENGKDKAYLIGLNVGLNNKLVVSPFGPGMYDGTMGIIVFLAQLAEETGGVKYKRLGKALLNGSLLMTKPESLSVSAFHGIASLCYGLLYVGRLWNDEELVEKAFSYIKNLDGNLQEEQATDFLGGVAGVITVLLKMDEHKPSSSALSIAKKYGEELMVKLRQIYLSDRPLLTGLSHGATGYAWPLICLGNKIGNKQYIEEGFKLLDYERSLYDEAEANWLDLRDNTENKTSPVYWCHGGPGIALGRIMITEHIIDKKELASDLSKALDITLKKGFGKNQSLCHGDFGNLDILLTASEKLNSKMIKSFANLKGSEILQVGKKKGWTLGIHNGEEMHGLMLGSSGVGYGLLRLWNPNIPSILAFELPEKPVHRK